MAPGGQRITVRLESLAFGGEAVAHQADGRVVFVSGGAPGDQVEVELTERKGSFARARLVRVLEPGPAHVAPPCPLADRCGGCPWQEVTPAAQLAAKQEIVRRALAPSGAELLPILEAPAWLGYRTRARMTARGGRVGFSARRSHEVVDVERCLALDPALDRALQAARAALAGALGEDGTLAGLVAPDGRVQLALGGRDRAALERAAESLVGSCGIVGVAVEGGRTYGEALLELDDGFRGSAAGFAQANAAQNEVLRATVLAELEPAGTRVLELYAGDGNFTRDLARCAQAVVAVEGDRAAASRLTANLAHWPQVSVRGRSSEEAVRALVAEGARFERALLDPPRAGAREALAGLVALGPDRIVYVSCDPMTLARDLGQLAGLGYRAVRAQPIDMMPHTSHIEVVCTLQRDQSRVSALTRE